MWLLFVILFIIGLFIIWPVLKIALKIHRQYRNLRRMMNGEFPGDEPRGRQRRAANRKPSKPEPKKKKIQPEVGEYVEFEEIETSEAHSGNSNEVKFKSEAQISDVEFEDIS